MEVPIRIETTEGPMLAMNIFEGTNSISPGVITDAPGGVHITMKGMSEHRAFDVPGVLEFVVDTAVNVDVGLFSAWLYDKVKRPEQTKITIKEREIVFEEGEIKKAIEREITEEK